MDVFLIRHFESIKNTQTSFSSLEDLEPLTEKGIKDGVNFINDINDIIQLLGLNVANIYCSSSIRAIHSAKIIAEGISPNVSVVPYKELLSTKSKETLGKTKEEVRKTNPLFIQELSLYDAGIFNSYCFHRDVGKNEKKAYEKMVNGCINSIIKNEEEENAKIIILHNSSITAAAIAFARKICSYPEDYYGKIIADNGKIFWIHEEAGVYDFRVANCSSNHLLKLIKESYAIK